MNIAGRILDPLGPLAQLWQDALAAKAGKTGLEPASVIELVHRAYALTGNASYCALVDRRKSTIQSYLFLIHPICSEKKTQESFLEGTQALEGA